MHRVHHFRTTQLAYNACFDDPHVREGDILVVAAERVVGIASTDPIAVTTTHGELKTIPAMPRDALLAELAHGAETITHAVKEALRFQFDVAPHFLAFAGPTHTLFASETIVVLTFDDLLVTTDAIDHQITALQQRLDAAEPGSSRALFTQHAIVRLRAAREKLASYFLART
jgi:hypothetical protein